MLKLLKYLKKSVPAILLIVALLVIQAYCDLSLPAYTSNIVDVGIQQGGVTEAAPQIIRETQLQKLLLFVKDADKETVTKNYQKLDKENYSVEEWQSLVKKYPLLESETLLERTVSDQADVDALAQLIERPLLLVSFLSKESEETADIKQALMQNLPPQFAGSGMELFEILAMLPSEAMSQMNTSMNEKLSDMSDNILKQSAISAVKEEYQVVGLNIQRIQSNYILIAGLRMLGIALISMAATILVGFLASKVAATLGMDLRGRVFNKVVGFSNAEFDQFSTASLITRSTNDIQQIQLLMVMLLRIVFYAPILGVGGVIKVLNTNTPMAWIIAVAVMAILTLVLVLFSVSMPKFKSMQKLVDRLNLVTREILTGLPVIRAFSNQKHEEERFDKANRNLTETNLFVNRTMAFMMPMMLLVMNGITLLIVWNGAHSVSDGQMQVGDMMAFIQYTMQIIMAFLMISMVSIMLPRASVSAVRIEEVLKINASISDPAQTKKFDAGKQGMVEFEDVSFRYPNAEEDVLQHITFTAKSGQTTALIGSTGSGKSTLINLIPRFYDVTAGRILVSGTDVRDVAQHALHEKIGYVPQKGVLFSGTIASNLKYGRKDASEEEMIFAAEIAQADDFIGEKTQGYEDRISQGGINVSGGQKQRISIARAIVKNPEIYIFDDSFSALDYKTDIKLRRAMKEKIGKSTVIIVAQRISTILHADQIIVLDEGMIVGKGTHRELMETCEVYKQIASSQLSKEELA